MNQPEKEEKASPTEAILERLHPLCEADTMVQLRLEGELTRWHYHQLDLNQIRRYGEEHCAALAIDDSALVLQPAQEVISAESDEREKRALQATKEELLLAMDRDNRKK